MKCYEKDIYVSLFQCPFFFSENAENAPNDNIKITKTEKETKIIELQNYEFRIDIVVTNITNIVSSKRSPSVDIQEDNFLTTKKMLTTFKTNFCIVSERDELNYYEITTGRNEALMLNT